MKKFYHVSTEIVEKGVAIKDTSEKDILAQVKNISQIPIEKSMDIFIETPMKKYSTKASKITRRNSIKNNYEKKFYT